MTARVVDDPARCRGCGAPVLPSGRTHTEDCDVLGERVNRLAAARSVVYAGGLQNAELAFYRGADHA